MARESVARWNPFASGYYDDPYCVYQQCRLLNPIQKDTYGNVILFKYNDVSSILRSKDFEVTNLSQYLLDKEPSIFKQSTKCPFLAQTTKRWLMYQNGDFHRRLKLVLGKVLFSYDFDLFINQALQETIQRYQNHPKFDIVHFTKFFLYSVLKRFIGIANYESFEKVAEYANMAARSQDLYVTRQMYLDINEYMLWGKEIFLTSEFKNKLQVELADLNFKEEDFYSIMSVTVMAFFETSKDALSNSLYQVLNYSNISSFVENADKKGIKSVTEELLRYVTPLQFTMRINKCEYAIGDMIFKPDTRFILGLASANRDEEIFENGETIIPSRKYNPHLAFGEGSHFCLGTAISRKEFEIALKPLAHFFKNYSLDNNKPVLWNNQIFMRSLKSAIVKRKLL